MIRRKKQLFSLTVVLIYLHTIAFSQMRTVTGRIIDETLVPMPGVSVATRDRRYSTFTDSVGRYSLQIPVSYDTVQMKMVGVKTELIRLAGTLTIANQILFDDNEEGYAYPPKTVRKLQRREIKRKAELYKKAKKLF